MGLLLTSHLRRIFAALLVVVMVSACSKKSSSGPVITSTPATDPKVVAINGGLVFKEASLMPMMLETDFIYTDEDKLVKDDYEFIIQGEDTGIIDQPIRLSKDNIAFTTNPVTVKSVGGKVKIYAILPTVATNLNSYKIQVRAKNTPNVFGRFFVNVDPGPVATIDGIQGTTFEDLNPYDGIKQEFENWTLIGDGVRDTYVYVRDIKDIYGNLVRNARVRMTIDRGTFISTNPATISEGVGIFRIQSEAGLGLIAMTAQALDANDNVLATATGHLELVRPNLHIDEDGNFGDILVNQELRRTFTLQNSGTTAATNLLYTVGLPFNIDNSQSTCVTKTRLRPGETCTLTVAFNGGIRQEFQSELRVHGSPTSVAEATVIKPLTSRVVAPASLVISGVSFDFGSQVCGGVYSQEFYVENTGDLPATGFQVTQPVNSVGQTRDIQFFLPVADEPMNPDPSVVVNCGGVIPPGRKCRVQIQFSPTALVGTEPLTGTIFTNGIAPFNIVVRGQSRPGGPVGTIPVQIFNVNGDPITSVDTNSTIISTVQVGPVVDGCGLTVANGTQLQAVVTAGTLINTVASTNAGTASFAWQSTNDVNAIGSQIFSVEGGTATGSRNLLFRGIKLVGEALNSLGQVLNDRTKTLEFRITNEGTLPATNFNIHSSPQGLTWFSVDTNYAGGCQDGVLNSGESCVVRVTIDPRAANSGQPWVGDLNAAFVFRAIENGLKEVSLPVVGNAVPPPRMTFEQAPLGNPPVINLGSFPAGAQVRRTLSLTNLSTEAQVNNLVLSAAPPFTIHSSNCGTSLAPTASCEVVVDLTTNSKGTYTSIVQALGEATVSTAQATIAATITAAPATGTFPITFTPPSVPANQTSAIEVVIGPIRDAFNNPVAPGTVVEITSTHGLMSLDLDGDGVATATTGLGSDEGRVRLTIRSRSLTEITSFTMNAAVKDGATVLASGTQTGSFTGALLQFTVETLDFGQVAVGALDFRTIRLQNLGNEPATNIVFQLSSQSNMSLNGQSACTSLAPGAGCDITVLFNPPQVGNINAIITALGQGFGVLTDTIAVTAEAVDAAKIVAGLNYNPTTRVYNQTNIELNYFPGSSNSTVFKVRNTGQDPLVDLIVNSGLRPGELTLTPQAACSTLVNDQECEVTATFVPTGFVQTEIMGSVDITGESASRTSTTSINLFIKAPHLVYTQAQSSLLNNTCGAYQVQLQDQSDNPTPTTGVLNLNLTHSGSGTFYSDSGCNSSITSISIPSGGHTTAVYYYRPTSTGVQTLTAATTNGVLAVSTNTTAYTPLAISPLTPKINIGGTVQFSASGGVPPYTYSIQSGVGSTISSSGLFTAVSGGAFLIRVTDNIGGFAETTVSTASWPTGTDGVLSLTTPGTYRIQQNSTKLRIVRTSDSAIILDNFGDYVNDGNRNNGVCRTNFSSATIASGVTLQLDTSCKWLMMGVLGNFELNGTIVGKFLTDLNASYAAVIPDEDEYSLVYFVNQLVGGSGGGGGHGFHAGAASNSDVPGAGAAQSQGGGGGGGGGDCTAGYGSHAGKSVGLFSGSSSRSGGSGGSGCNGYNNAFGGSGGNGGSYGRHGQGVFVRVFGVLSGNGSIDTSGENGGIGGNGGNGAISGAGVASGQPHSAGGGGGGGGGAGGSGGKAIIQYAQNASSITVQASGGSGGSGGIGGSGVAVNGGSATNGINGADGTPGADGVARLIPFKNYYLDLTASKTITVPAGISSIDIFGCGGGGGGGGGTSGYNSAGSWGGGGGGGSLGGSASYSVQAGDILNIVVGGGGAGGPGQVQGGSGFTGGTGGDTILYKNGVELIRFLGGTGGGGVGTFSGGGAGSSRDGAGHGGNGGGGGGGGGAGGQGGSAFLGGSGGGAGSGGGGGGGGAGRYSIGANGGRGAGVGEASISGDTAINYSCSGGGGSGGAWYSSGSYANGGSGGSGLLTIDFKD